MEPKKIIEVIDNHLIQLQKEYPTNQAVAGMKIAGINELKKKMIKAIDDNKQMKLFDE